MNLFPPPRCFDPGQPELVDRPDFDPAQLREELRTLEDVNRKLGGHELVLQYVRRFLKSSRLPSLEILDLGTGMADIPRAIVGWGRRTGLKIAVTAVDANRRVLDFAHEACRDWPEIQLEQQDLLALPYPAGSFDLVLCSLVLHHFDRMNAVKVLGRIHEIARRGFVVNDLRRNRLAIWSADLCLPALIRSRVFCQDARQSCRAAFTLDELRVMAGEAGLERFNIRRHHGMFRMVLEGTK